MSFKKHPFSAGSIFIVSGIAMGLLGTIGLAQGRDRDDPPFLPSTLTVSTVPTNGDVNPYGVAFVPRDYKGGGLLAAGDILVSNFNNGPNLQGTGSTILRFSTAGATSLFFQSNLQANHGLSTALVFLRAGYVIVGSFPTADGTSATAQAGSLLIINQNGQLVGTIADPAFVNGPWGGTVVDRGDEATLFIANALSGTVVRFDLEVRSTSVSLKSKTQIGSGYIHRGDPAALEVSPTGLVFDSKTGELYVASTGDNKVFAIWNARFTTTDKGTGRVIYTDPVHLHGALGLAMAPNRHLLVTNSDGINSDPNQPSEIVEFTLDGVFVRQLSVDTAQGGSFGLAVGNAADDTAQLAAVDDNTNSLKIWNLVVAE